MKPFHIYNSLSRTIEEFRPANPPEVTYYSCGPTVYLPQNLGNMRAYVFVDTLRRALEFNGYTVRHVMNITDVGHMTSDQDAGEDKVEKTARAEGKSPLEIANRYIAQFKHDCGLLNIELPKPPLLSRATDHVPQMISLIERIVRNGLAYIVPSGVYFDVLKWRGPSGIGRLSRQSLDDQHSGQRLDHASDKKSPHDFALWVLDQPHHLMQWDSPWGRGYPGWHIECSAMSMQYLGATLDIHSGGLDHIPVHHENEIAQSESATGQPFVRYFVHNAFLVGMEGAKISKSAGKFPVVQDLITAGINPLAFRMLCLGAKYRSELAFSLEAVRGAERNLEYLYNFAASQSDSNSNDDAEWSDQFRERIHDGFNNDLNTPQALAAVLELVAEAYRRNDRRIWGALEASDAVFGFQLAKARDEAHRPPPDEIVRLSEERAEARRNKDFARADLLRSQLLSMGYVIEDTAGGARLKRRWEA